MTVQIGILAQTGMLLDELLEQIAGSNLQDAVITLSNAAVDHKTSTVLHKGRPLGFSFIDDCEYDELDLLIVLESGTVVEAYKEKLHRATCPIIGMSKSLRILSPETFTGEIPQSTVIGVLEPAATALLQVLPDKKLEALDCKVLCSAELFGLAGIQELAAQTAKLLNVQPVENKVFSKQLPFNFFPIAENQFGRDLEAALKAQLHVAFDISDVSIEGVQMPVFHGQTVLVSAIFADEVDLPIMIEAWQGSERIQYTNNTSAVSHLALTETDMSMVVSQAKVSDHDAYRLDFWLILDENPVVVRESLIPLSELLLKNSL